MNRTGASKMNSSRGGTLAALRERAVATRACLLAAARELFAEAGYHATGTHEIVARAAVTRGALYHHFADKVELFQEVFRAIDAELVGRSNSAAAALTGDTWAKIVAAFSQYLKLVASNQEYQRILLIDGPAVLGWARWRELQSEFVAKGTADALRLLMDQGIVARQPAEPLAYLIQAALNDAAMGIAYAQQPAQASQEAMNAFLFLLHGIRQNAGLISDEARPV
jgi:AcrR family transcriptional regulator